MFGLGLRPAHFDSILAERPAIDFFEAMTDDYLIDAGPMLDVLLHITAHYPLALHGVGLSIGSVDPLDQCYLEALKRLMIHVKPRWVSDHLCWTGVDGVNTHDLLPLPFTSAALAHVVSRVKQVQDTLGRQILLENVSSYVTFKTSMMPEWAFLREVAEQADCGILLDVNNIYVNAINHGFDPQVYLAAMPAERVAYFHLAGYSESEACLIDTHGHAISDPVWTLYKEAAQHFPTAATLIERDEHMPPLAVLLAELDQARRLHG